MHGLSPLRLRRGVAFFCKMNFAVKDITVEDVEAFDRLASLRSPNGNAGGEFYCSRERGRGPRHLR